jgi:hypothetical protein
LARNRREFESYLVWALALAGDQAAEPAADGLLGRDANNPLACFARMLAAIRAGDLEGAVGWVERAGAGTPIPEAKEAERAAGTLSVLVERGELAEEATLVEAAIYVCGELPAAKRAKAKPLLESYLTRAPGGRWGELAERLERELSDRGGAP